IVYITHDLATAYQISDTIVVLYRGSVAEAGDVELVVKRPRHPYTQLLLSSIPLASPERTWLPKARRHPRGPRTQSTPGASSRPAARPSRRRAARRRRPLSRPIAAEPLRAISTAALRSSPRTILNRGGRDDEAHLLSDHAGRHPGSDGESPGPDEA